MTISSMFGVAPRNSLRNEPSELLAAPDVCVGVEAELSHAQHVDFIELWTTVEEGSLHQSGVEWVFSSPMFGQDVVDALNNLEAAYSARPPKLSYEASLHVHVDVRDLSAEQYGRYVMLYALLEPLLFEAYCPTRKNNPFCVQLDNNPTMLLQLAQTLNRVVGRGRAGMHISSRYGGINLLSTSRFGSLEFRGHPPEYQAEPILEWTNVLLAMRNAAVVGKWEYNRPHLLFKHTSHYHDVLRHMLGKWAYKLLECPQLEELVKKGCTNTRIISNIYGQGPSRQSATYMTFDDITTVVQSGQWTIDNMHDILTTGSVGEGGA